MKKTLKISGIVLGSLIGIVLLAIGVLNLAKFAIYADYYSIETSLCKNPGLGDGFVCQGICAYEAEDKIFVSGYMDDDSASRIYISDTKSNSYFVTLSSGGEIFDGHAGGIAVHEKTVYLGNGSRLYTFSVDELLGTEEGGCVDIGEGIKLSCKASFVFADDNYVYVGEFHDGGAYVTNHPYQTENGMHYAVMTRYTHDNLTSPDRVYSIRNKVQGVCVTDDGKIVLSTSYGISDSHYYVYNEDEAVDSGLTQDGAPVYFLTKCIKDIKGPAMAEGMDCRNGKIITLTESASNKYIFGKFFFANKIVELDI